MGEGRYTDVYPDSSLRPTFFRGGETRGWGGGERIESNDTQ